MTINSYKADILAVAPFGLWMALMFLLPSSSAWAYAVRTVVSAIALIVAWRYFSKRSNLENAIGANNRVRFIPVLLWGILAGVLVTVLWIAPEYLSFYRKWCIIGDVAAPNELQTSAYDPKNCGWTLTILKVFGSAFIIAPAEELFFRSYLYRRLQDSSWLEVNRTKFDLSAFLWTTCLFALEHNRIVAAILAGVIYLLVYMRQGFWAAALAHIVTNFLLAIYVIYEGAWAFW